jgi:hypothetical protein
VVIIFEHERDARRVLDVLPKRLAKYGLTLHPEKTRLVDFRRPDRRVTASPEGDTCPRPGTFDLLGFTHYRAMSRKGYWVVKQKTAADRFRRTLKRIADWCRRYRHEPSSRAVDSTEAEVAGALWVFRYHRKLQGAAQPAIPGYRCMADVVEPPLATGWAIVGGNVSAAGALSTATAAHPCPHRHLAKPWTEEPDAGNSHVRLRGSLGGAILRGDPTTILPGTLMKAVALMRNVHVRNIFGRERHSLNTQNRSHFTHR